MPSIPTQSFLGIGELADLLSVQSWRIARLFELGLLPEPSRVSGRRMIPREMLPAVIEALELRGWLPKQVTSGLASNDVQRQR